MNWLGAKGKSMINLCKDFVKHVHKYFKLVTCFWKPKKFRNLKDFKKGYVRNSFRIKIQGKSSAIFDMCKLCILMIFSKWTLLKSCGFFLILLRLIINLAHDFKSPFLAIEITFLKLFSEIKIVFEILP